MHRCEKVSFQNEIESFQKDETRFMYLLVGKRDMRERDREIF